MTTPLVSVCLITYNHEKYIAQAIEGVLMQETDYKWELVIADDFSTDNTRTILLSYKEKYPEKIKLILQEKNVGANTNWIDLLSYPSSKYIAYFEGDDYWVDKKKLQKQVTFLESHADYGLVHTNYKKLHQHTQQFEQVKVNIPQTNDIYNHLLTKGNIIGTLTTCFRRDLFIRYQNEIDPFNKEWKLGDLPLWIYFAKHAKVKYIDDVTCVYRVLDESGSKSKDINKLITFEKSVMDVKLFFSQNLSDNKLIESEFLYKKIRILYESKSISKIAFMKAYLDFSKKNKDIKRFIKASVWLLNKLVSY